MRDLGRVLEALRPGVWSVVVLEAGRSKNGVVHTATAIREGISRGVFENAPIGMYPRLSAEGAALDHVANDQLVGASIRNTIGKVANVRWSESLQAAVGEAQFSLGMEMADALEADLRAHMDSGNLDVPGLSIDAVAEYFPGTNRVRRYESLVELTVVSNPSAGGRFVGHRIAASVKGDTMFEKILRKLREDVPGVIGAFLGASEDELKTHLASRIRESAEVRGELSEYIKRHRTETNRQAVDQRVARLTEGVDDVLAALDQASGLLAMVADEIRASAAPAEPTPDTEESTPEPAPAPAPEPTPAPVAAPAAPAPAADPNAQYLADRADVERRRESIENIESATNKAGLPESVANALVDSHVKLGEDVIDTAQACRLVESYRLSVADIVRKQIGERPVVTVTGDQGEKRTQALTAMLVKRRALRESLMPKEFADDPSTRSLHRFMEKHFLGRDWRVKESALGTDREQRRLAEAIDDTNFDDSFADAMHKAVIAEFGGEDRFVWWDQVAPGESYPDFRDQKRIAQGYYGAMPTVAENGAYGALTTPTDTQETNALTKRGGLESITLEKFTDDDLGTYQRMIQRIARAQRETLQAEVAALIRSATQPTMQDSEKLTSATRGNQGAHVLSADAAGVAAFTAAVTAMMALDGGSGYPKGVFPSYVVLPFALANAWSYIEQQIGGGNTGVSGPNTVNTLGVPLPTPLWDMQATDANDWYLIADPDLAPCLEVGFLNGRQEPETFIANGETFGAMFTNDRIEIKTRYIRQPAAVSPWGIYGAVNV